MRTMKYHYKNHYHTTNGKTCAKHFLQQDSTSTERQSDPTSDYLTLWSAGPIILKVGWKTNMFTAKGDLWQFRGFNIAKINISLFYGPFLITLSRSQKTVSSMK
jgi:hypothetical protein